MCENNIDRFERCDKSTIDRDDKLLFNARAIESSIVNYDPCHGWKERKREEERKGTTGFFRSIEKSIERITLLAMKDFVRHFVENDCVPILIL